MELLNIAFLSTWIKKLLYGFNNFSPNLEIDKTTVILSMLKMKFKTPLSSYKHPLIQTVSLN